MNIHKDSEISDLVSLLQDGKTDIDKRIDFRRLLQQKLYSRLHPDLDRFIDDKQYLGLGKAVRPNIRRLLHIILDDPSIDIAQLLLGSGAGKSYAICIAQAYKTHQLLSLIDPASYYRLSPGTKIGIVNMSVGAGQALNVIFAMYSNFISRISSFKNILKKEIVTMADNKFEIFNKKAAEKNSDYYSQERYSGSMGKMSFEEKNIIALSGHSRPEAFYGYSVFMGAVDETDFIGKKKMGHKRRTAIEEATSLPNEIIQGLQKAIWTRFHGDGLLMLISTTDSKSAPLTSRVLETKREGKEISFDDGELIIFSKDEKIEKDRIECYRKDNTVAVVGATWHFDETYGREHYIKKETDIVALRDYGCVAPDTSFGAIPNPEIVAIRANYERKNPITPDGLNVDFSILILDKSASYHLHGDLSRTGDNAALAMCHRSHVQNKYVIDFAQLIITSPSNPLSFSRVVATIKRLSDARFNISCTFDGWQSVKLIEDLNAMGIPAGYLSADTNPAVYDTLLDCIYDSSVDYPAIDLFVDEVKYIQWDGIKYDHPDKFPDGRKGSKDMADSVAGALFSCVSSLKAVSLESRIVYEATLEVLNLNGYIPETKTPYFTIENDETHEYGAVIWESKKYIPVLSDRYVYIDSIDSDNIVMMVGYKNQSNFIVDLIDEYAVEGDYLSLMVPILKAMNVEFVSCGTRAPFQLVENLRDFGIRNISADMSIADKARNRDIRTVRSTTWEIMATMISAIQKKGLTYCDDENLLRDLYEISETNFKTKPLAVALGMWYHYAVQNQRAAIVTMPRTIINEESSYSKPSKKSNFVKMPRSIIS